MLVLKETRAPDPVVVDVPDAGAGEAFARIRCPKCEWRPQADSTWCCLGLGTPEQDFVGCLTVWNTFATGGVCPGCRHQWQWTSCLHCHEWSLHKDWYEEQEHPQ